MKRCCKCKEGKPLSEFNKNRSRKDGLQERCRACQSEHYANDPEPTKARTRAWAANNPERKRAMDAEYRERTREERLEYLRAYYHAHPERSFAAQLQRNYGMTIAEFEAHLEAQDHRCSICRNLFGHERRTGPCVDHNHATGVVRGLLCQLCNRGIGMLREDPVALERAIQYLAAEFTRHAPITEDSTR